MADRTQGIFTVLYPANTASWAPQTGFGSHVRVQTTQPFVVGDYIQMDVTGAGSVGYTSSDHIVMASSEVEGSSRLCDLICGWDGVASTPALTPPAGPMADLLLTASVPTLVDCRFTYRLLSGAVVDDQTFTNLFTHEPLSQTGNYLLQVLWWQAETNRQAFSDLLHLICPPFNPPSFRASHVGLAGSGTLVEADARGVRCDVTSSPPGWGRTADTPPRSLPAYGNVQFDYGLYLPDRHLLHYDGQLVLADRVASTEIRYNVEPGWLVDITAFD